MESLGEHNSLRSCRHTQVHPQSANEQVPAPAGSMLSGWNSELPLRIVSWMRCLSTHHLESLAANSRQSYPDVTFHQLSCATQDQAGAGRSELGSRRFLFSPWAAHGPKRHGSSASSLRMLRHESYVIRGTCIPCVQEARGNMS